MADKIKFLELKVKGKMTEDVDYDSLWSIFRYIGTKWQNGEFCKFDQSQLKNFIQYRISTQPIYKQYYDDIVDDLNKLIGQTGSLEKALEELFNELACPAKPCKPLQTYVLSEFILILIAFGGFKKFGYMNYPGYLGGPYDNPSNLPYRSYNGNN